MNGVQPRPKGFALVVEPGDSGAFALLLEELPIENSNPRAIAHLPSDRTERIIERVLDAVRLSGLQRSDLSANRREPLVLREAPGVRLALTMFATGPLRKHSRVEAVAAAIERLSEEESYYWYGKCVGETGGRSRRALRLLLAEE